jgi:hypothetical protein
MISFCRGLIVPVKEKKKERRSKIMRKLGRSKTESVTSQEQRAPGLVGLLEIMRAQLEARNNIHLYFFSCFSCLFGQLY